jgi:hypothetical protein
LALSRLHLRRARPSRDNHLYFWQPHFRSFNQTICEQLAIDTPLGLEGVRGFVHGKVYFIARPFSARDVVTGQMFDIQRECHNRWGKGFCAKYFVVACTPLLLTTLLDCSYSPATLALLKRTLFIVFKVFIVRVRALVVVLLCCSTLLLYFKVG